MLKLIISVWIACTCFFESIGQLVSEIKQPNSFSLSNAVIYIDDNDFPLVKRSAELLQQDIEMVTGKKLPITNKILSSSPAIIIGSLKASSGLKQLLAQKKINTKNIDGKWEAYILQSLPNMLIIAGNDRRGTAYGVFEFSKQIGVSPWYWWADVPVKKKEEIFVKNNVAISDAPKVKYRGIFINDEAPALSGWTKEKFGGFNHLFYEKVFELILRLKGNYLWPAMWGNAFYYDDSLNVRSADKYGIVIGTSHHEPLMRAHEEWKYFGKGRKWNYDSTEAGLKEYWRGGMQRAWNEKIVSVGMRGDGDAPMSRETATELLERIVKDQRQIIEEVTGKPAGETPQLWALYKEVQDYYDKGMRVPDDVTLLLCDDNWGNLRKLPKLSDPPRKGGYGIYYHFDYVGGPRNYKWINTNNIARVWEQMHLAYEYGVKQIWIVNVGDIKPMEFPISFFLDYAWDPGEWNEDNLREYYTNWAAGQFGQQYAKEIGEIIRKYSQYAARRKPELLDANTYQFTYSYGDELIRVLNEWQTLQQTAEKINNLLAPEYKDAFFELVLHPVKALNNLHQLYGAVAQNRFYLTLNWPDANRYADYAKTCYIEDSLLTLQYHQVANGKWNHMMDQTHIGYTYWQQPPKQVMPEVRYVPANAQQHPPGVALATYSSLDSIPANQKGNVYYEKDGVVSINSARWTRTVNGKKVQWKIIPDIGKDGDGVAIFPVNIPEQKLSASGPRLEYEIYSYDTGTIKLTAHFSPTLNFHGTENGLQYAISIDDEVPQMISINKEDRNSISGVWNKWVADNIIIKTSTHKVKKPGKHVVKYWLVNSGLVLQKLVLDFGGLEPSYLGPPETRVK